MGAVDKRLLGGLQRLELRVTVDLVELGEAAEVELDCYIVILASQ